MTEQQARALISRLTLEEKIALNEMLKNLDRGAGGDPPAPGRTVGAYAGSAGKTI